MDGLHFTGLLIVEGESLNLIICSFGTLDSCRLLCVCVYIYVCLVVQIYGKRRIQVLKSEFNKPCENFLSFFGK